MFSQRQGQSDCLNLSSAKLAYVPEGRLIPETPEDSREAGPPPETLLELEFDHESHQYAN